MCLVFLAASAVVLYVGKTSRFEVKKAVVFMAIAVLTTSPWLVRNYTVFGNPLYTSARYVPFYTEWGDNFRLNPPSFLHYIEFISDPMTLLAIKGGSILKTFVPPVYSATRGEWQPFALIDPIELGMTVAGFLTYPLLFVALYLIVTQTWRYEVRVFLVMFAAAMALFGLRHNYTQSMIFPGMLLLGVAAVDYAKDKRWLIGLSILCIVIETAFVQYYIAGYGSNYDADAMRWIRENTPPDAVIMSAEGDLINVATDRVSMMTPNENESTIVDFMRNNSVDYYAVSKEDFRLRGANLTVLEGAGLKFEHISKDFFIYAT